MINTMETIILVLLTIALVIAGPLMIAEGVTSMVSDAASKAWENWSNFINWFYESIDSVIFGKKETSPSNNMTTTTTRP
ncbi:MAG: hypothetical protein QXV05_00070 [Candidatus Korarchaeum sp.]